MAPPKGNKFGLKLKEPDIRQRAYDQYCDWLAKGKSPKSFSFHEGDVWCTHRTIQSYMKNNPDEFPAHKREAAFAKGYAYWESIVDARATGENQDADTPTLNMLMRNKYKWDHDDPEESEYGEDEKTKVVIVSMKEADDYDQT